MHLPLFLSSVLLSAGKEQTKDGRLIHIQLIIYNLLIYLGFKGPPGHKVFKNPLYLRAPLTD